MELCVHLKVCEACGCLWFRTQAETGVYCSTCRERFKEFPSPQSRIRRGRPRKAILPAVFAVEDTAPSGSIEFFSRPEFHPGAADRYPLQKKGLPSKGLGSELDRDSEFGGGLPTAVPASAHSAPLFPALNAGGAL